MRLKESTYIKGGESKKSTNYEENQIEAGKDRLI